MLILCFMESVEQKDDDDNWEDDDEQTPGIHCIERWRNAGPEDRKRMFALFEESGIFIASCRHRLVLLACDMIKSGELCVFFSFLCIPLPYQNLVRNMASQLSTGLSTCLVPRLDVRMTSGAPFPRHLRTAASLKRRRMLRFGLWSVLSMGMHIIATASFSGIHCISVALAIRRVKVASMSFRHQMTLPGVHAMPLVSIATKVLRNISIFGIRTNTQT